MNDIPPADVAAFFAGQMLLSLVKNLVAAGLYLPDVARTNIQETIDQGTEVFSEIHHRYLVDMGREFFDAVQAVAPETRKD